MQPKQQSPRVHARKEHATHLSTIISSLLSAFESTRHLYQRIKNDKRPSSKKLNKRSPSASGLVAGAATWQTREEDDLQLHLQRAPRQIEKVFKANSERWGEGYRRGDERAKTSLNRILLVLNTGLTKIIATLLRKNDRADNTEMIRQLVTLSERSARDSVMELEGFRMRLESMSSLALSAGVDAPAGQMRGRRRHNPDVRGERRSSATQVGKTAQGQKAKKTSTMTGTAAKRTMNPKRVKQVPEIHPVWVRSKNSSTTSIHLRRMNTRPGPTDDHIKGRSRSQLSPPKSTAAAVASPPLDIALPATSAPAPAQNLVKQEHILPTNKPETLLDRRISILSHSSASTKLGEIPQHKWINAWIPPVEVDEEGHDPENQVSGGGENEDNGRTGGMRFWRRFGRNRT